MHIYRVLKITRNDFLPDPQPTTHVIWEGANLDELSRKFLKSDVMGADELGFHQIEDGWISWHHRFESRADGGEWSEINDPRHKVYDPEHEALEAAIDEENRRLFPGDYEENYDDDSC